MLRLARLGMEALKFGQRYLSGSESIDFVVGAIGLEYT
ncbi:hypothetical protein JNB_12938 [Janibacter sp. HTCC2649]|nr:hypothetical protein JNB_12938 [Janibacter sp. HTCC2649]